MAKYISLFSFFICFIFAVSCENPDDGLNRDTNGYIKFVTVVRQPNELIVTNREFNSIERSHIYNDLINMNVSCYFDNDSNIYLKPIEGYDPKLMMWSICSEHDIE